MPSPHLFTKRVYEDPSPDDGFRVLVDRLWPRGMTKERAAIDLWLKDIAPSPELRKGWCHNPATMHEFADLYRAELDANPAVQQLRDLIEAHDTVTLLYAAKDPAVNHAVVLQEFLKERVTD